MIVLFKIEGNFPCLRARSAHMVGNLLPAQRGVAEDAPAVISRSCARILAAALLPVYRLSTSCQPAGTVYHAHLHRTGGTSRFFPMFFQCVALQCPMWLVQPFHRNTSPGASFTYVFLINTTALPPDHIYTFR